MTYIIGSIYMHYDIYYRFNIHVLGHILLVQYTCTMTYIIGSIYIYYDIYYWFNIHVLGHILWFNIHVL